MNTSSNLNFPVIKGIIVDLSALLSIEYSCDSKLCNGKISCCSSYDICIDENDVNKIIPHFSEAFKFASHIKEGDDYSNIFEETDDGLISLETDNEFTCKLAWKNKTGDILCSLHSHALKNNLSFYDVKPKSCCLWPLAQSNSKQKSLTIDSDCLTFPCVRKKESQDFKLNKEVSLIIKNMYGDDFLSKVNHHILVLKNSV